MILFFDIETTGLPKSFGSPAEETDKWPRAVQISWLLIDENNNVVKQEDYLIKPVGFRIPLDATQIHKTSHSFALSDGEEIKRVLEVLKKDLTKVSSFISFNAILDKNVLIAEFIRAQSKFDFKRINFLSLKTDASYFFRNYNKKGLDFTLSNLYYLLFNEFYSDPNTSKGDVQACYKCFKELGVRGVIDLSSYEIQSIVSNNKYHDNFTNSITKVEGLLSIPIEKTQKETLYKMLYVNIITLMETYLSDAFINTALSRDAFKIRFIETTPDFKDYKLSLNEIYKEYDKLDSTIKNHMSKMIYHNLGKVNKMYFDTLEIVFPTDLKSIYNAIEIRHDLVHRNGKDKDGKVYELPKQKIQQLISDVIIFINDIDRQLEKLKKVHLIKKKKS